MFSDNQPKPRNCSWKGISGILGICSVNSYKNLLSMYMKGVAHMSETMTNKLNDLCKKDIKTASNEELYHALLKLVDEKSQQQVHSVTGRKLYYISAEFLIGKLLSNNLINLGLYDDVKEALAAAGKSLADIEEQEPEPSLGNGGLGRLAACFLDSLATLNLPGDGVGLRYHCGLFHQNFKNNIQNETPDFWLTDSCAAQATDTVFPVSLAGKEYSARLYKLPVTGYEGRTNTLNLFDLDTVDESVIGDGISFDKKDIAKNLTLFLYPDDSDEDGRLLRIYQQYFMVSAGAQLVLEECAARGCNYHNLADYAAIQINDTHPSMVIPELIRLLMLHDIDFEEAVQIVTDTCAYTNHTILAEALEKWPRHYLDTVVPQLMPIIEKLDALAKSRTEDGSLAIIDQNQVVHMAHMDIHFSHSTNGVATLHTQILKESELAGFYHLYPEKFNNKTNGITFRRWLLKCNPSLTNEIESLIGNGFKKDASELKKLLAYTNDQNVLRKLSEIKKQNKIRLAKYIKEHNGIDVNPDSIFDVQVKRLHEYKRQLMNILHVMYLYNKIKENPSMDFYPRTFIFGAKAAAGYRNAKKTIKLINSVADVINNDASIGGKLKVVFIEDYKVSNAEIIFAAADVSEQISTASKEASGTGNMKFMLNGALTIGTMDGANVEMFDEVGADNMFIFGMSSDEVISHENRHDYNPVDVYNNDAELRKVVNQLVDGTYSPNDHELFRELYNSLLNPQQGQVADRYFILADFRSYANAQQKINDYYKNKSAWRKSALLNIAHVGKFSSDRTIQEYVDDIWHLDRITVNMAGV